MNAIEHPMALLLYLLLHVATNLVGGSSAWQQIMDGFSTCRFKLNGYG